MAPGEAPGGGARSQSLQVMIWVNAVLVSKRPGAAWAGLANWPPSCPTAAGPAGWPCCCSTHMAAGTIWVSAQMEQSGADRKSVV